MLRTNQPDDLVRAAIPEAGHVIIRHHHGLLTPSLMIQADGTGVTFAGESVIDELQVRLDVSLAGYAAKTLFDKETLFPLVKKFITAQRRLIDRSATTNWDDYVVLHCMTAGPTMRKRNGRHRETPSANEISKSQRSLSRDSRRHGRRDSRRRPRRVVSPQYNSAP